jgi:lipopolysaccharide/colanic/teichoic acid biosynthesis glycosyltransferase
MKRLADVVISASALVTLSPLLLTLMYLVWRQDGHNPFYIAERIGRGGKPFRMVKLRSMVKNADRSGVMSTAGNDMRITPVGHFIRRYKIDEIVQLWNVLKGDMSVVGPRPNVWRWAVELYTEEEMRLLSARPGITDFASIVFADEGSILQGSAFPDLTYNQLIRPGKSRLGLFYIEHQSLWLDLRLMVATALTIVNRQRALDWVAAMLRELGADASLCALAQRRAPLVPAVPPGGVAVVSEADMRESRPAPATS